MAVRSHAANLTGLVLSVGCVIHCMLMPLCIASLPKWGLTWLASSGLHQVLAILGVLIGVWTLVPGWRIHRRSRVMVSAVVGLSIMNYSAFFGENCCEISSDGSSLVACTDCEEGDACLEPTGAQADVTKSGDATNQAVLAEVVVSPGMLRSFWNFLWHHPTVLGAALLGLAHFMNGSCTRGCCGTGLVPESGCDASESVEI